MKQWLLNVLCVLFAVHASFAQETLKIHSSSKMYVVLARVAECAEPEREDSLSVCSGAARVSLSRKGAKSPFQILRLPNIEIYRDPPVPDARTGAERRALKTGHGVVFDDFDFDGAEDLAICNGREGGYSGPSYTVFLFDRRSRRFVENKGLSRLAENPYLGLFTPDAKRKQLIAQSKSGCCYHQTEMYKVVRQRPVLVEKITEHASGRGDGKFDVVTTTKRRINGRWITKIKREPGKEN